MVVASRHETIRLDAGQVASLRDRLAGEVLTPSDAGYDARRSVWNGMIDKRPALIVVPAHEGDIQRAVRFAVMQGLAVSIKGGGHNVAGHAVGQDTLMLDMDNLRAVEVDPLRMLATVQAGAQWGDFDRATAAHGLATTGGVISTTGVAGLTLGGGIGYLVGKHGMSIDNLRSVRLVTADGELITANHHSHPDLFWALRGGGGNFGVVTSFTFALHPQGDVLIGLIAFPVSQAREVLEFYRSFIADAPDELGCYALLFTEPESMTRMVAIAATWPGDPAEGERVLAPLATFGEPVLKVMQPMPYTEWQAFFDASYPHGRRYYWKGNLHRELTDDVLDGMVAIGSNPPITWGNVVIEWYRGAMNRVDPAATAFPHRDAEFQIVCIGGWDDPVDDAIGTIWTRSVAEATGKGALNGAFLNFNSADALGDTPARVQAGYGPNLERLREIKRRYDPTNLFRENNNIAP
jgi:UDP-N-acetylenolpyruvoylglucosamine reductase